MTCPSQISAPPSRQKFRSNNNNNNNNASGLPVVWSCMELTDWGECYLSYSSRKPADMLQLNYYLYNEICQSNFQMVLTEAKTFQT